MNEKIENLCKSLDALAEAVEKGRSDEKTLNETLGWNHPAVTPKELAHLPKALALKIRNADLDPDDEDFLQTLDKIPAQLERLKNNTIPQFFNNNGPHAIPAYVTTLSYISSVIEPHLSWVISNDTRAVPPAIFRRLKKLQAKIDEIDINQEELVKQKKLIDETAKAAESLPSDLEDLEAGRKKVDSISQEVLKISAQVSTAKEDTDNLLVLTEQNKLETDDLVDNCEEAYLIATSKGLAGAFDQRAKQLANSMRMWVIGLSFSLIAAGYVGAQRIEILTGILSEVDLKWGIVLMHFMLTIVSLGAPLWFAWLSTKQISQRFKLAEDYGFKASVAKAYEGYRREAARIDEKLEARLFESALTRVEEAPLRFVDDASHGTPWHELAESSGFKGALKNIPGFRDKILALVSQATHRNKSEKTKGGEEAAQQAQPKDS